MTSNTLHLGSIAPDDHHFYSSVIIRHIARYSAINDILISLACDRSLDIGSIRTTHKSFRHRKSRPNLAIQQWNKPLLLLFLSPILCENLHISRIGCSTIGRLHTHQQTHSLMEVPTSGARRVRPVNSAMMAYSRFVNPAPSLYPLWRNRFHSPRAFAFFLRCSTTGGMALHRSAGICASKSFSVGMTSS